jgi:hypothetical protein
VTVQTVRVRRDILETPVRTFACPGERHLVTLTGTVHIGEKAYYNRLHALAAGLEADGALIQYELVTAPEEELSVGAGSHPAPVTAVHDAGSEDPEFDAALTYLGWVSQCEMRREPSWENAQMDFPALARALIRAVGTGTAVSLGIPGAQAATGIPRKRLGSVFAALIAAQCRTGTMISAGVIAADRTASRLIDVLIGERTMVALDRLPSQRDAALPLGAEHLPGLAAGLEERGYVQVREEWIRAESARSGERQRDPHPARIAVADGHVEGPVDRRIRQPA